VSAELKAVRRAVWAQRRAEARAKAEPQPKYGPQNLVRQSDGVKVYGRPDEHEQRILAETVGARIRELRGFYGLSLRDLERRSGLSRGMLSQVERGLRRPRPSALGWIAWGLVGAEAAPPVKDDLCEAAGAWLVADSRWSERAHARRAWAQIQRGGMELPSWLAAPYCVAILGQVMPEKIDQLREAQKRAREGLVPWPEAAYRSIEVDFLAREIGAANLSEFRSVGRGMAADAKATVARQRRRQRREVRARLGLTGTDGRRPVRVPRNIPAGEHDLYRQAIELEREASTALAAARQSGQAWR
jgi:transcriptional regulator with XRE-family HTH domain